LTGKVLSCPGIATSFPRSGTGKAMKKSITNVEENSGPLLTVETEENRDSRSIYIFIDSP
jgi:hypothetical protein